MSDGLTAYHFVQQVYYAQEKVLLDFYPDDDKFKEVLVEANLILQELQNAEDWTWLREQIVLGPCYHVPNEIPEFELPGWVYKVSTLNHDALRLHPIVPHYHHGCADWDHLDHYDEMRFIPVPIASSGDNRYIRDEQTNGYSMVHMPDPRLRAVKIGNVITFTRPLTWHEERSIAVLDVQRRIEQFHVCDHRCKGIKKNEAIDYDLDENGEWKNPCAEIAKKRFLTEIPDPNYVVMATAARHAEGSPPALARVAGLQDAAQKIMSAMRQNDAASTDADYQDWDIPGFVEVV